MNHDRKMDGNVPLGRSGLEVAPLGWGMWRFAGADLATARRRIDAALEIGCTLFDTADIYGYDGTNGFGAAEALLGRVYAADPALRRQMVLATKAGIVPTLPYDSSARHLVAACEASLARLGTDCIDLWQIHRPDLLAHPAEVASAFETLKRAGKIRAAGVSNYSAQQTAALLAYLPFPLASIQPEFSALAIEPLSDGLLDLALAHGIAVLAWSPLAQGRLGGVPDEPRAAAVAAALAHIAARAGVSGSAAACAWIMQHPARPVPLLGSQNPERLRELGRARGLALTRAEWYRVLEAAHGRPMP